MAVKLKSFAGAAVVAAGAVSLMQNGVPFTKSDPGDAYISCLQADLANPREPGGLFPLWRAYLACKEAEQPYRVQLAAKGLTDGEITKLIARVNEVAFARSRGKPINSALGCWERHRQKYHYLVS